MKDILTLGDEVEARVIKIDKEERRIGLSVKAAKANYSEEALKAAGEEVTAALGNVKVGEMLDEDSLSALDNIQFGIRKEDAERESKK